MISFLRRLVWLAFPVLLVSAHHSMVLAQGVSVRARTDSTDYLLGDRITVRVDLRHTPGLTIQPLMTDTLGGFTLLGQSGLQRMTDSSSRAEFVLARYDSGDAVIPPLPFLWFVPGDTTSHIVRTNQLRVTLHTVPPDTSSDIKDVKPVLSIPLSLAEILLYAGIVVLVVAIGYGAYRYWKRRRIRAEDGYVPPPRPAHAVAFEELGKLKARKLWQQGQVKLYYSELTEILRRYFENRYSMPALEETTDEILAGLQRLRPGPELMGIVEGILRRADLVKFAKAQPTVQEHEESFTGVHQFVDRTKIVEMTPVPVGETKEKANVVS